METSEEYSVKGSNRSSEEDQTLSAGGISDSSEQPLTFNEGETPKEEIKSYYIVKEAETETYIAEEVVPSIKYTGDTTNLAALKSDVDKTKTLKNEPDILEPLVSEEMNPSDTHTQHFDYEDKLIDFTNEPIQQNSRNKRTRKNSRDFTLWPFDGMYNKITGGLKDWPFFLMKSPVVKQAYADYLASFGPKAKDQSEMKYQQMLTTGIPEMYTVSIISEDSRIIFCGGLGSMINILKDQIKLLFGLTEEELDDAFEFDETGDLDVLKTFVEKNMINSVDYVRIDHLMAMFNCHKSNNSVRDIVEILTPFRN